MTFDEISPQDMTEEKWEKIPRNENEMNKMKIVKLYSDTRVKGIHFTSFLSKEPPQEYTLPIREIDCKYQSQYSLNTVSIEWWFVFLVDVMSFSSCRTAWIIMRSEKIMSNITLFCRKAICSRVTTSLSASSLSQIRTWHSLVKEILSSSVNEQQGIPGSDHSIVMNE